ncbi:MAG: helical backbone metal receptor [Acidobacteriota bacterium]
MTPGRSRRAGPRAAPRAQRGKDAASYSGARTPRAPDYAQRLPRRHYPDGLLAGLAAGAFLVALALGAPACSRRSAPPSPAPAPASLAARVVSLAPNLTEIAFAVGAGERLVGVSDFSDYPPAALAIPRVGGVDVSAERIASLHPDLVLASGDGGSIRGAASALASSGVPVLAVSTTSLDEVLAAIRVVGARLGRAEAADELARRLDARRRAVAAKTAGARRPRAILLVWPDPPQAAGGRTFLDDVLSRAGADNLVGGRPGWPVLSSEWLATAPIEVVVVPDSPGNRPVFDRSFSTGPLSRGRVKAARIVRVDESVLTRPGPRVFDALESLAADLPR